MSNQPYNERPFIVKFDGQTVTIHHPDVRTATEWTQGYFSLGSVTYMVTATVDGNRSLPVYGHRGANTV
jgi:hypothetical protein